MENAKGRLNFICVLLIGLHGLGVNSTRPKERKAGRTVQRCTQAQICLLLISIGHGVGQMNSVSIGARMIIDLHKHLVEQHNAKIHKPLTEEELENTHYFMHMIAIQHPDVGSCDHTHDDLEWVDIERDDSLAGWTME